MEIEESKKKKIDELHEKARLLPLRPGVYLMKNSDGKIIYVGKAKLLRNRVSSYFRNLDAHNYKTKRLVLSIDDFDYIFTDNEVEAFVLENELIKLHMPRYNIMLKDDKSYPYICFSKGEFPRLFMVRSHEGKKEKGFYFGPYTSSAAVKSIIDTANRIFKLPSCRRKFEYGKAVGRPCLNYHLGKCMAPCTGKIKSDEYKNLAEHVTDFLRSDFKHIVVKMEEEMKLAAQDMRFEEAAVLRDRISALERLKERQKIVCSTEQNSDVFGFFSDELGSAIAILHIREGRIVGSEEFTFGAFQIMDADSFESFFVEYYMQGKEIPSEALMPNLFRKEGTQELFSSVLGKEISVVYPQKGEKNKLVELASSNAHDKMIHRRELDDRHSEKLVNLASLLELEVVPERIEAYDISNTGNDYITAGMISLENAKFDKSAYRVFNIRHSGQDDIASMTEALSRRADRALAGENGFALPDLILIDGGNNQVNAVKRVFEEKNITMPIFGMVKDGFHKTRALTDGQREISIAKNNEIFRFIYSIQEEVHRFALSRMDARRSKKVKSSSLCDIKGIGEEKSKKLLSFFKTLSALKAASHEEISSVKGISSSDADNVYKYFHSEGSH